MVWHDTCYSTWSPCLFSNFWTMLFLVQVTVLFLHWKLIYSHAVCSATCKSRCPFHSPWSQCSFADFRSQFLFYWSSSRCSPCASCLAPRVSSLNADNTVPLLVSSKLALGHPVSSIGSGLDLIRWLAIDVSRQGTRSCLWASCLLSWELCCLSTIYSASTHKFCQHKLLCAYQRCKNSAPTLGSTS